MRGVALAKLRRQRQARPLDGDREAAAPVGFEAAGDEVHRRAGEEARDEGVCRIAVDVHRRTDLHHLAVLHDADALPHGHRLDLVVGDMDDRGAHRAVQFDKFGSHCGAQLGVEVRQRLVQQERLRLPHERAAERNPLTLAAGKL
jgi:hypothetical protein